MIREVSSLGQISGIISGRPYFESTMRTCYACYKDHPAIARFYKIDNCAVLMIMGKGAALCGEVTDLQELASFLRFSNVTSIKTDGAVPEGFVGEGVIIMQYHSTIDYLPPKGVELETSPNMRRLSQSPSMENVEFLPDDFYADACARKVRGLADIWAISQDGEYISTAGVYSLTKNEAYISAVTTHYASRDRGYASFLVYSLAERYSDRRVILLCNDKLQPFYEKLGFQRFSTILLCKDV